MQLKTGGRVAGLKEGKRAFGKVRVKREEGEGD